MNDTIVLALQPFTTPIDSVPDFLHSMRAHGARSVFSIPPPPHGAARTPDLSAPTAFGKGGECHR
ncbi:MAG TPA: hypothetical protein VGS03_00010 [Candidatus Polarisedimenticolia bacterium]|jgi:hypothetical protein|nr:hypothetical protein [Candidatus Polarisedimenticolia bacterium]